MIPQYHLPLGQIMVCNPLFHCKYEQIDTFEVKNFLFSVIPMHHFQEFNFEQIDMSQLYVS